MKVETAKLETRKYFDELRKESKVLDYSRKYERSEGSDLVYYLALNNLDTTKKGLSTEYVVSVLKTFLYEWNFNFYQVRERRDGLEDALCELWNRGRSEILRFRKIDIRKEEPDKHKEEIMSLFEIASESKSVGKVGAAKALHMVCPSFLTPWDNQIWTAFHRTHKGYHTSDTCKNDEVCYNNFISQCHKVLSKLPYRKVVSKHPNKEVAGKFGVEIPPTKILDECNWVRWNLMSGKKK